MKKPAFIIILSLSISTFAQAQQTAKEILHQKTEKQLTAIIDSSLAVTGLMAVDLTSDETFACNADIIFPQASAIKIPVLMEVYKQAHLKKFALTDLRKVESPDIVGGTGIISRFTDPASLSIRNLCVLMIALSDNSATNSLLKLVGIDNINATLQSLGLKQTRVQRKMIDEAASAKGLENISTPAEAVKILETLYKGQFIDKAISEEILSILKKNGRENSRLASGIPSNVPIAFKPGELNGVSTEWAIVFLKERPYAIAMMENYKPSGQNNSQVMESVSKILYQYFWRMGNASRYGTYVNPKLIN